MKYKTIMHGITGDFEQLYESKRKAEKAAKNIAGLGYAVDVIPIIERSACIYEKTKENEDS